MPTNPPATRAALVEKIRECWPERECCATYCYADHGPNEARLNALLDSVLPPDAATVTVLCACGHGEGEHYRDDPTTSACFYYDGMADVFCRCTAWVPTRRRVTWTEDLTEEERTR